MPSSKDILWFKTQFGQRISAHLEGTPFDLDMLVALACQETGEIWPRLRGTLPPEQILELCVGDVIDYGGGRRAFPVNKADLLTAPRGDEMFAVARQALVDMAAHIPDYRPYAAKPDKFCHGFGVFQRDIQFFTKKPDYFLSRRYIFLEDSLAECLEELGEGLRKLKYEQKTHLTDIEFAYVAIAYNTGGFNPRLGLKQGYKDKASGKRYGEYILEFVQASRKVQMPGGNGAAASTDVGLYTVIARGGLKVRNGPGLSFEVSQTLPAGTEVHVVGFEGPDQTWARIDLEGDGLVDGHVFAAFLKPESDHPESGDVGKSEADVD